MKDYYQQALNSLRTYLRRSRELMTLLEAQKVDRVLEMLRLKSAAYHNFRYADGILMQRGVDVGRDRVFLDLWNTINPVDVQVESMLRGLQDELRSELLKTQRVKAGLGKYRSGRVERSEIYASV